MSEKYTDDEILLSVFLSEKNKLTNQNKRYVKKITKIRKINFKFNIGAIIFAAVGIITSLQIPFVIGLSLLMSNIVTFPSYYKYTSKIEENKQKIIAANSLIEQLLDKQIFPEFKEEEKEIDPKLKSIITIVREQNKRNLPSR